MKAKRHLKLKRPTLQSSLIVTRTIESDCNNTLDLLVMNRNTIVENTQSMAELDRRISSSVASIRKNELHSIDPTDHTLLTTSRPARVFDPSKGGGYLSLLEYICTEGYIQALHYLLNQMPLNIYRTIEQKDAMPEEIIELLLLYGWSPKERQTSTGSSALDELKKKVSLDPSYYFHIFKKYEWDRREDGLYVSLPLLRKFAPSISSNLVENQLLVLNDEEKTILQHFIDAMLYNSTDAYILNEPSLTILFMLDHTNDCSPELKKYHIAKVINATDLTNVVGTLLEIEQLLAREISPVDTVLSQLKEYCLDYIAVSSRQPNPNYDLYIENDKRLEPYLRSLIKRSSIHAVESVSIPFAADIHDMRGLGEGDIDLKFSDDSHSIKTVRLHKTLLSSRIPYFETVFKSDWNHSADIYEDDLLDLIDHCYHPTEKIAPHRLVPVMIQAHKYEMTHLLIQCQLELKLDHSIYMQVIKQLEHYLEEPSFEIVSRKLIIYGVFNAKTLFNLESTHEEIPKKFMSKILQEIIERLPFKICNEKRSHQ